MVLSLKPHHLTRYKDIARLFIKYGRGDLLENSGLEDLTPESASAASGPGSNGGSAAGETDQAGALGTGEALGPAGREAMAQRAAGLADDLEKLGPTYVKVGQFLSTRADLLPPPYVEALSRLQDRVEPVPFADIERIVCDELGVRLSKAFARFEEAPLASASLGQVHRAEMRDGTSVAVKVQRPNVRATVREDLEVFADVAGFLDAHTEQGRRQPFSAMVDEFRKSLLRELDYRQEARHMTLLAEHLRQLDLVLVPRPVDDYVTSRVLTMEFVAGRKVTAMSPLAKLELDGAPLAEALTQAYLHQMLVDGFFHGDPHPGNVLVTDDGRLALIDLGMVGQLAPTLQEQLLKLVLAISEGRGEDTAEILIHMGRPLPEANPEHMRRRVAEMVLAFHGMQLKDIALGRFLFETVHTATEAGYKMPRELTMVSKALLNVDQVARELDPMFDPNESIRRNAAGLLRERMLKSLSPGRMFAGLLDAKDFAEKLPRRITDLVEAVAENRVRIQVDAIDEVFLMEGMQKIANRITAGVIIGAMIVGAALLMRIETRFHVFGYPAIAIVFFLAAGITGLGLVFNIVFHDIEAARDRVRARAKRKQRDSDVTD